MKEGRKRRTGTWGGCVAGGRFEYSFSSGSVILDFQFFRFAGVDVIF